MGRLHGTNELGTHGGTLDPLVPPDDIQATGSGGPCIGDSGGPEFLDLAGAPILVSLTSSDGDLASRALDVNHRLDTPSARPFLGQFMTLP